MKLRNSYQQRCEYALDAKNISQSFASHQVILCLHAMTLHDCTAQPLVDYPSHSKHRLVYVSKTHCATVCLLPSLLPPKQQLTVGDASPHIVLHFLVFILFVSLVKQDRHLLTLSAV